MWLCGFGLYRAMRRLGRGLCFGPDNISIWARHMAKADLLQIFIRDISDAPVRSGRPAPKLPAHPPHLLYSSGADNPAVAVH
jgi:hypothetical protein